VSSRDLTTQSRAARDCRMIASRWLLGIRRREPASLELAANDADPDNAERERHGAHAMERWGPVVKTRVRAGGKISPDKLFRSSELSAMINGREIASGRGASCFRLNPWRKRRSKEPIKLLKTNVSAKSRDFVPNDFNGLPLRIVSLGASFPSFGAPIRSRQAPPEFTRKETS
jgi:hypothetical protein